MSQQSFVLDQEKLARYPQQPHGGKLVNRLLTGKARDEAMERAKQLPMIVVDMEAVITLEMIATGVLSPNEGFMNEADYKRSEEHTSELQSRGHLVCRLLL